MRCTKVASPGISVSKTRGYGEYADFYSRDEMTERTRIEIFIPANKAESVATTIIDVAHVGLEGDGIVAITPVDKLYRIRSKSEVR